MVLDSPISIANEVAPGIFDCPPHFEANNNDILIKKSDQSMRFVGNVRKDL